MIDGYYSAGSVYAASYDAADRTEIVKFPPREADASALVRDSQLNIPLVLRICLRCGRPSVAVPVIQPQKEHPPRSPR
jgi:hypothetical protein